MTTPQAHMRREANLSRAVEIATKWHDRNLGDLGALVSRIAAALDSAEERASNLSDLAGPLAAYDAAGERWQQANAEQNDAPAVRDAERYSDALENAAHAWAAVVRDLVDGNPPAGPTRRATFRSSASDRGAPGYPERTGQPVDVLRPLNPTEADLQEVGPMYRVRFPDGVETTAYANELAEAADDVEDLDRCANECTCTPEERAAAGELVDTWGWQGVPDLSTDELPEHLHDRAHAAPEGLAVFAHWSTAHTGVNVEIDAPNGLPLTVHVNDWRAVNIVIGTHADPADTEN